LVVFPNSKINLGLSVLDKRADSFHNIETVFYPIAFKDALEIIPSTNKEKEVSFSSTGLAIKGNEENNLCVQAYQLLKKDFRTLPPVQMHLHKAIPMGAGLGGGSADGAFTLRLLNEKFNLQISTQQLINYALQLGSDCPFFIINQPAIAEGRGEVLQPVQVDLSPYKILIVNPAIHINTGHAFLQLSLLAGKQKSKPIKEIITQPIISWQKELCNDFEKVAFIEYPPIKEIKENLYRQGALYAAMSGSGSSVFGIFEKDRNPVINFPKNYYVKMVPPGA
jgi:4-diphosphocytidyl-2-C-methyl-D-erythritol kinase